MKTDRVAMNSDQKLAKRYWLPSPAPNRNSKGHYNTFIQEVFNEEKIFGDEVQPTAMEKNLGRCDFCSNFSFKPATNKTSKHIPSLAKTKG